MGFIRRLYQWTISWANHPAGWIALIVLAFSESSFFPIPPDLLLIPLAFGKPRKSFFYASLCTVGSVVGGMFGYLIGWGLWSAVGDFFFRFVISESAFQRVGELYDHYAFWAVMGAGFTPIPYKVFTIAAGAFQIQFVPFVLASLAGRGGRFFLVALLIFFFGERVRTFIEKHFEIATVVLLVGLFGGFVAVRFLF